MRRLFSFVSLLLLISIVFGVIYVFGVNSKSNDKESDSITYLICGYDTADWNTDALILVKYSFASNDLTFLQIPRDTYYKDASYSKINSIYPDSVRDGLTPDDGFKRLTEILSKIFKINIDGYLACSMDAFVSLIDELGGIDLYLPSAISIYNSKGDIKLTLQKGTSHLNGNDSLSFIRARNGYVRGDIARLDAQKLFISSFMKKLKADADFSVWYKVYSKTKEYWHLDARITDFIRLLMKNRGRIGSVSCKYSTLPGEAWIGYNGISYFGIAIRPTYELLSDLGFNPVGDLDIHESLLNSNDSKSKQIYFNQNIIYKVYDDDTLSSLIP